MRIETIVLGLLVLTCTIMIAILIFTVHNLHRSPPPALSDSDANPETYDADDHPLTSLRPNTDRDADADSDDEEDEPDGRPFPITDYRNGMMRLRIAPMSDVITATDPSHLRRVDRCVPKILHICWRNAWVAENLYHGVLEPNGRNLRGFEARVYTNETIFEFLSQHFPPHVVATFALLNPEYGACLSDFFRYCVLYISGGIYLDIKAQIIQPLGNLWSTLLDSCSGKDLLLVSYWPYAQLHRIQGVELGHGHGEIMNWVLCSTPGHPFLKKLIDTMVHNIQMWHTHRYRYGEKINVLRLTGPILLTRMILNDLQGADGDHGSIRIDDTLNQYVRYSTGTSPLFIKNDRSVYDRSGIPHYSALVDPIVLCRYKSYSRFIFYFESGSDAMDISATPLGRSVDLIRTACGGGGSDDRPTPSLRPIPLAIEKRLDLIRTALVSLDLKERDRETIESQFPDWESTDQEDLLICAVLYDHGGCVVDPHVSLYTEGGALLPWDLYSRQVDVCVLEGGLSADADRTSQPQKDITISRRFLQFPAQSSTLRLFMKSLVQSHLSQRQVSTAACRSLALVSLIAQTVAGAQTAHTNGSGSRPRVSVFPVGISPPQAEMWLVASVVSLSDTPLWKSVWTRVPDDADRVAHFSGQILGAWSESSSG